MWKELRDILIVAGIIGTGITIAKTIGLTGWWLVPVGLVMLVPAGFYLEQKEKRENEAAQREMEAADDARNGGCPFRVRDDDGRVSGDLPPGLPRSARHSRAF